MTNFGVFVVCRVLIFFWGFLKMLFFFGGDVMVVWGIMFVVVFCGFIVFSALVVYGLTRIL